MPPQRSALVSCSATLGRTLVEREQHEGKPESGDHAAEQPKRAPVEWTACWRDPRGIEEIAKVAWVRLQAPAPLRIGRPFGPREVDRAEDAREHGGYDDGDGSEANAL